MSDARRKELLQRLYNAKVAQDDLLNYVRFTMPDAKDPSPNPRTRYLTGRHHELMARKLHDLEAGRIKRMILNLGPRHGKTELASKRFASWWSGRHPEQSLILGTYNEVYAGDIGRAVRDNIQSHEHQLVFPDHTLKAGSEAAQRLETTLGGQLSFVGRGGSITGRGGHGLIIDDPIKDRKEADSQLIRDQLWDWFNQVIGTRMMTSDAWIMLIQTRWHEDDLVGRLTDPLNAFYNPEEAKHWTIVDLPALALENDPLNRKPGEALWPERFPVPFLEEQRRRDPRGFQALYQGRPSPDSGTFFHAEWLRTYRPDELPSELRIYAASDHAVSTQQFRDKTVLIVVGVAENGDIYVLPNLFWRAASADVVTDAMLNMIREHRPLHWWAERGHISKAIGPFLRRRMAEEKVYGAISEITPVADKQTRAQSIQGRMAMGKVYFPAFAPWWPEAKSQLMKFPFGAHDDFVDALAYIGLGLAQMVNPHNRVHVNEAGDPGTFRNMFYRIRRTDAAKRRRKATDGW
jgi:predicted phage terminase large subunit-like protein